MDTKGKHVLVVDDEEDICAIVQYHLSREGYLVDVALSAEEAVGTLTKDGGVAELCDRYDLIVLDVMMPGMSGFEFAKLLRANPKGAPSIIFLTAMDAEENIVEGLRMGADDYIAKPFSPNVLKARVEAVLRRTATTAESNGEENKNIEFEGIIINTEQMTLEVDGEVVQSTRRELDILILLLSNPRKVFSRADILIKVWPDDVCVTERTVDVNITRLRKKLGKYSNYIHTRVGYGYSFKP